MPGAVVMCLTSMLRSEFELDILAVAIRETSGALCVNVEVVRVLVQVWRVEGRMSECLYVV